MHVLEKVENNIPLLIGVTLGMSDITLNATNTMVCTFVEFDDNTCRDGTLELFRTNDNANSITFRRNSTAITCKNSLTKRTAIL